MAVAAPNTTTATSIFTPTSVFSGRNEKKMAVSVAPTAGAARSGPRPSGADLQDVARIDRQHRRRSAEQHGEQVERDGAEHQPVAADVGQAVRHLLQRAARLERGPLDRADGEHADGGKGEQDRAEGVRQMRRDVVQDAADRRAGDRPGLPRRRTQRDRVGQDFARHEVGRERAKRGPGEGARNAEQCRDAEQDRQADEAFPCRDEQDQRAQAAPARAPHARCAAGRAGRRPSR